MTHKALTFSRRHILGDLYDRCDPVVSVPIYWNNILDSSLGYVEEGTDKYVDAFTFYMSEELCKKLAAGQLTCSFDYEYVKASKSVPAGRRRIKVTAFILVRPKTAEPLPSKSATAAAQMVEHAG